MPDSPPDPPPLEPPVPIPLMVMPAHACPYLPDRLMTSRAFAIRQIPGRAYHDFMDANFRRSGTMIYQPTCAGCRECRQLRVIVDEFRPTTSQRRAAKRNADLVVTFAKPDLTDEKIALYGRYVAHWHDRPDEADAAGLERFLYDSPTESLEFEYRDPADGNRLLAIGICDVCSLSLSSVYFYFDPAHAARGLGNFGAVHEIAFARAHGLPYYYLGFWIRGCAKMRYKANYLPHEVLRADGSWERVSMNPNG